MNLPCSGYGRPCNAPAVVMVYGRILCRDCEQRYDEENDWNGETGNHLSCEAYDAAHPGEVQA